MEISILDFVLINIITYGLGISSGLSLYYKFKYKISENIYTNNNHYPTLDNPALNVNAVPSTPNISEIIIK